jgi:hypothetical protein
LIHAFRFELFISRRKREREEGRGEVGEREVGEREVRLLLMTDALHAPMPDARAGFITNYRNLI